MARTVLIVDDSNVNRKVLSKILREDYAILEAENGREAMALLGKHYQTVSAMLLDIIMPDMDGYAVLEKMQANPVYSQIPVIVTTASAEISTEKKAFVLGANDFVPKPFDPDILKRRLDNLIKLRETAAMVNTLQKDKLTGVWNRETFFQKAAYEIKMKPAGYFILGCVDIDNFKVVNDQYGMQKGDELLVALANALKNSCEKNGGICGRIAADHFVSLYPRSLADTGLVGPIALESSLLNSLSLPVALSVGRYVVNDKQLSVSAMYDRACIAQETVKGRYDVHVAVYDEAMRSQLVREQEIVNEMNGALASGQFEAWYQPQYNHSTGALIGAEALARWRHPTRGMVSPAEFIPVFERNGFVYELDKFIWEQVCQNLRRWLNEGRNPLPVSVNLSRYDLFRKDLPDVLIGLSQKYDVAKELLRLEITESAFAQSSAHVAQVVSELIAMGFTIEIDDFGSGYSSLNTLKDVPAQIIKLDMRFLESSDNLDRGGNILESIVRMSKWLGMSVIAEGVETVAQADFLKSIGCSYVQGYLYARPMPVSDYETLAKGVGKEERLIALETVENLDNNAFWSPESMDTLIFNSYVGAACIFEYQNGTIDMIRSTQKFADMLGGTGMSLDDTLRLNWNAHLDGENSRLIRQAVQRSAKTKDEIVSEFMFLDLPGCPHKTYLRAAFRVIATAGSRALIYNVIENITAQRETDEQLRFLNDVSFDLLSQPQIDVGIDRVLRKTLEHFDADRVYVVEYDDERQLSSNTYEVCAPGVNSEMALLRDVPTTIYGFWLSAFQKGECIIIGDVSALPKSRAAERKLLKAQGIGSLVAVPLHRDGRLLGFVGADNPARREGQAEQLRALGDFLTVLLTRRDLTAKIENDQKAMRELMEDTPGGFTRMRLTPDGRLQTLYANQRLCDLRHMTHEELMASEGDNAFQNVHPDDMATIRECIEEGLRTGETRNLQYRLRGDDGAYQWFSVSGRASRAETGEINLNIYYADTMSEREQKALSVRETLPFVLSAIMASSPDLAYAKDKDFRYICCCNAFARFAGRKDASEVVGKTDFELFPEATAQQFRQDDMRLFADGESLIDYTEPIPSADGIQHYSVTSKYLLRDSAGEIIGLYGCGRDVTDARNAFERLKLLTDSIPGGIASYAMSPNSTKIIYFNDGFCKMLGCTREQYEALSQTSVVSRVFADDLPMLEAQIARLIKDGTPIECTYRCHRMDGDGYIWIDHRGRLVDRQGDTVFVNAALYDVTEAKKVEQRLRDTDGQMSAIMRNMNGGVAAMTIVDDKITYLFTNDRYCAIFGYTPRQFSSELKNGLVDLIHKDDKAIVDASIAGSELTGGATSVEFRAYGRDGSLKWIRSNSSVCRMEGVDAPVHVVVLYDITQEKTTASQLESILSGIASGVAVVIPTESGPSEKILVTDRYYEMLGYTRLQYRAEISNPFDTVSPDDASWVEAKVRSITQEGQCETLEFRVRRRDGQELWFRDDISVVRLAGVSKPAQLSAFTDITQSRATDARLQLLADNISGGLASYVVTPDSIKATYFNDGFCKIMGYSREEYEKILASGITSLIFDEDLPEGMAKLRSLVRDGKPVQCVLRIHDRSGNGYKWLNIRGSLAERRGDMCYLNAVVTDITQRQEAMERLRVSEAEYRLAVEDSGRLVYRYDHRTESVTFPEGVARMFGLPTRLKGVPQSLLSGGLVAEECEQAYRAFYAAIKRGDKTGSMTIQRKTVDESWRWFSGYFSNVYGEAGKPLSAIIVFYDVTEQREKEAVYSKWQQSLADMSPEDYTLFRWNLSQDSMIDSVQGSLLTYPILPDEHFMDRTRSYALSCVDPKDRESFTAFMNADAMLASYYRGKRYGTLAYRETKPDGQARWLKLTVELVEYSNSSDVCAYIMFENIDSVKKEELLVRERAELDPLTGVLNRAAFIAEAAKHDSGPYPDAMYALMMLDVDGFKLLNDTFGHAAGDEALIGMASAIRSVLRPYDLLGRLGGDEFVVYLENMQSNADIQRKAEQICTQLRKAYSSTVQVTASIGIAVCPRDGDDFDTLYRKADAALYSVKKSGKDNYAFYHPSMGYKTAEGTEEPMPEESEQDESLSAALPNSNLIKRRMLIVEDNSVDMALLLGIFEKEFTIEKAADGASALIRLRHYGTAISVVLLDLIMPGMDGYEVLEKIRSSAETQSIPVIVVSSSEDREASLRAIRCGATDFVAKPVDPEVIRIRVQSAISKAENERLRAQNSYLSLQSKEVVKYRAVLERAGTVVVEHDWKNGVFAYDPTISRHIAGNFNTRRLWHILLSDFVASAKDVQDMQTLVFEIANDRKRSDGSMEVSLKTPSGKKHRFRMDVIKQINEFNLTDKMILTFNDLEAKQE